MRRLNMGFCLILLFAFCGQIESDQAKSNKKKDETSFRNQVLKSDSSAEVKTVFEKWFKEITEKDLHKLKEDCYISIALYAAAEAFIKRHGKGAKPCPKRFLGFFEGRTGLAVPLGWEVYFMLWSHSGQDPKVRISALKEYISHFPGMISKNGTIVSPPRHKPHSVIGQNKAFLLAYDNEHGAYPVVCVDSKSKKRLWKANIWGPGTSALSGVREHDVWVVINEKAFAVFGNVDGTCYAEGFDLKTGKNLFRFSYTCGPFRHK